jgi:DNA-binding NarL/FixJ family response regulator
LRTEANRLGLDVTGEAARLPAGEAADFDADAFLVAPDALAGPREFDAETEESGALVEALTPRETDVLELLALGLPNKAIAARLAISDQTVKFHVAAIYGKLGASNRTDAVRRALRRGIVTL